MRIHLHTGEAPAIHTLMNELEPEMASQEVFVCIVYCLIVYFLDFCDCLISDISGWD